MTNQKEVCKICGTELSANGCCPNCTGNNVGDTLQETTAPITEPPKKGKNKFVSAIISVLVIVLASAAGKFLAREMMGNKSEKDHIKGMDAFIAQMENYVPGTIDGDEYSSKHWEIKFDCNNEWELYSEAELKSLSEGVKQSAISSSLSAMEKEDISQELRDKWEESLYAETEMAASYIEDDIYVGQVMFGVFGMYGSDNASMKEYVSGLEKQFKTVGTNVHSGKEKLAGREYDVIYADVAQDDMDIRTKYYVTRKDNLFCMITLQYIVDYEKDVTKAFEQAIEKY